MGINKIIAAILLLGLITSANGIAQTQIQLNPQGFYVANRGFYIAEVIDGRKDTTSIGYSRNWSDKKNNIVLAPDMVTAIQDFADFSLPHDSTLTPVVLKVLFLQVKEERVSISNNTARAEIKLEFYKDSELGLKKIFEIEHFEDRNVDDFSTGKIAGIYEILIRSVLEHCFNEFSQTGLTNEQPGNSINRQTLTAPSTLESLPLTENNLLLKWVNIISYQKIISKHTEGWRVSYVGFTENEKVILPFIYSFDRYRIKPESLKNSNYKSANYFTPGFGTVFYHNLFSAIYINVSLQIPVGVERLVAVNNENSNNFIIGIESSQELMFIPKSDFGLVFGVGIYQKAHTSKIFQTNFGVEFRVGIKF